MIPRRRPVRLCHVGVVEAEGVWIDVRFLGEITSQGRVCAIWRSGSSVWHTGDGLWVRFPSPVRIDTRTSVGLVTVRVRGRTATLPLSPRDLAATEEDTFVSLRGGDLVVVGRAELRREDPSTWLDLGDARPIPVVPLGDPPPPVTIAVPTLTIDARVAHGIGTDGALAVTELSDALKRMITTWRPPPALAMAGARALTGTANLLSKLRGLFARGEAPAGAGSGSGWIARLDAWGRALGLDTALGGVLGQQHSRYLAKMVSLFEGGSWLEALRHAIPLSGVPADPALGGSWLTWLMPRGGLGFSGPGGASAGGVTTDGGLFEYLKGLYRRAFEALDAQGRVKEAAYVLGELLAEHHEAVKYLEDHGAHRLAAELAETKELDAGLVVLLWIRAGDPERARALARLRGAWAAAVEGFERRGLSREARVLRWEWAASEAAAGRHAAAVAIAWVVPELRPEAAPWLDQAIDAGGIGGARALARKVQLSPQRRDEVVDAFERLLADRELGAELVRAELAAELTTNADAWSTRLLVPVARALVRDTATRPSPGRDSRARGASKDGVLSADLPTLPTARAAASGVPLFGVGAGDTGTTPIHDAVLLPRGQLLLALGELGARLVGPDGRTRTTWAMPTHRLVPNPLGTRVLLLGRRGATWRLARLDIVTRALAPWCDARLDLFAPTFDGGVWFVTQGDRLMALDTTADGLRALWNVNGLCVPPGPWSASSSIYGLHTDDSGLFVVCPSRQEVEWFRYELPSLALRERRRLAAPPGLGGVAAVTPRGFVAVGPGVSMHVGATNTAFPVLGTARTAWSVGDLDGCEVVNGQLVSIELSKAGPGGAAFPRARFLFPGATRAGVRLEPARGLVVVWDDLGRVRVLDLEDDTLRVDVRC